MLKQPLEHIAQVGPWLMAISLADCTKLMTMAARLPASSLPANSHALRPMAHGRIWFSIWLLSIATAQSRRNSPSASQRRML